MGSPRLFPVQRGECNAEVSIIIIGLDLRSIQA